MLSHCGLLMDNAELFVYVMSSTVTTSSATNGQLSNNTHSWGIMGSLTVQEVM